MAILKVAHLGNPIVRKQAVKVDPKELESDAMQPSSMTGDTMREYDGVGLARRRCTSPSRSSSSRQALERRPHRPRIAHKLLVLVNPTVKFKGTKRYAMWEGCLSVPGLRGRVPRMKELEVEALDREGKMVHCVR